MKKIILITLYCFALQLVAQSKKNPAEGIFMDKVEKRSERVFIQSKGRVLRKDALKKKHYGIEVQNKQKKFDKYDPQ